MGSDQYIARPNQLLSVHSRNVAESASRYVAKMGGNADKVAYIAGLLHDIGKSAAKWQAYIKSADMQSSGIHHSVAGACCVRDLFGDTPVSRAMAYAMFGHHSGLPDYSSDGASGKSLVGCLNRDNYTAHCVDEAILNCSDLVDEVRNNEELCACIREENARLNRQNYHLYARLIASALVDADHLDAEYVDYPESRKRRGYSISMRELLDMYNQYCAENLVVSDTVRGRQRKEIRERCIETAVTDYGDRRIYKLPAPTGSGKTLSSLAFALNHAVRFGRDRIIYVVPYISIIEQTADLFRKIFGLENVIEHHSKFDVALYTGQKDGEDQVIRYKNAIENWDAPIIITTANQFYESCMAAKTSRIQKLHNIINSVVVIDEVQVLPDHAINAAMGTMKCFASIANTTFLLMTATMPDYSTYGDVLMYKPLLERLSDDVSVDIIEKEKAVEYFSINPPIHYEWAKESDDFLTVSKEICEEDTDVLVITNTRRICRTMYEVVRSRAPANVYHLSNTMCGEHISRELKRIRVILEENRKARAEGKPVIPLRVISTSLVEAGVDLDFPVVYREMIGFDSIIQAAGRCNREGRYEIGKVRVFSSLYRLREREDGTLDRDYLPYVQAGIAAMESVMGNVRDVSMLDTLLRDPEFIREYYTALLKNVEAGEYGRLILRKGVVPFRSVGDMFKFIEDQTVSVLIHFDDKADELIAQLKDDVTWPKRDIIRRLRRYVVPLYERTEYFEQLSRDNRFVVPVEGYDGLWEQTSNLFYDKDKTGLNVLNPMAIPLV